MAQQKRATPTPRAATPWRLKADDEDQLNNRKDSPDRLAPQVVRFETCLAAPISFHPLASLFPLMEGKALDALREDIRQNGVREPITMMGSAILDGRNCYMCARDLGLPYPVIELEGDDPLRFIISRNLSRRHLNESQRASIAARIANLADGERADRRSANLPTLPLPEPARAVLAVTQAVAAQMLAVSERSVRTAKQVQDDAPELAPAVDAGNLSVSLAAQVAKLAPEVRAAVVAAEPTARRSVAQKAVKRAHVANNTGHFEWYTPPEIIEAARRAMGGIDFDPASSEIANRTVRALRFFTKDDDALSQEWPPRARVWLNAPFSLAAEFAERFAIEVRRGSTGIALFHNATETKWFQGLAANASALCMPRRRIRFLDPSGNKRPGGPLQGQILLYFGDDVEAFRAAFSTFGLTSAWSTS